MLKNGRKFKFMQTYKEIFLLIQEMIARQKSEVLHLARTWVPHATEEDVLQPQDEPVLENNPFFRYEEGVLHGLQAVEAALSALSSDSELGSGN